MCEIIVYQEHFPTMDEVETICKEHKTVKKYCISFHDKDLKEDGELKKPHYHVYLHFGRSQNTDMCMEWFNVTAEAIEKIKGRWSDAEQYAVHANSPNDYQYDPQGVRANYDYPSALAKAIKEKKQKRLAQTLATSVINGEKSYRQAFKELSEFDYTKDGTRFLRDAYGIYSRNLSPERNIEVIFLYGEAGAGKTTLAKLLSQAEGKDCYISASGTDPMGDYMGEKVLILDDVREETFSLVEWLKLLDNNTNSAIRSRYNNKIFTGDTIYITSASNPVFWFLNTHENRSQFFRRISQFICVTPDKVVQYNGFTVNSGGYVEPVATGIYYNNPVAQMYPKQAQRVDSSAKFARSMVNVFERLNKEQENRLQEINDMSDFEKLTSKENEK